MHFMLCCVYVGIIMILFKYVLVYVKQKKRIILAKELTFNKHVSEVDCSRVVWIKLPLFPAGFMAHNKWASIWYHTPIDILTVLSAGNCFAELWCN